MCPLQRVVLPRHRLPRPAPLRRHPLQPAAVPQLLAVGGAAVRGRGAAAARGRQSRAAVLGLVAGPVRPRRGLRGQPRPRPRLRGGQVAAGGGREPQLLGLLRVLGGGAGDELLQQVWRQCVGVRYQVSLISSWQQLVTIDYSQV